MSISFQCPFCQKPYKVKDELAGKKAPCNQCKSIMTVPRPAPSSEESHAIEALATAALVEESKQHEALAAAAAAIKLECEYCFKSIEFALEKAGKKAPCPSCKRIITVPQPADGPDQKKWREVKTNLTMARKSDEPAPEGAWGNAQLQQQVVSREALLEAKVIVDRKKLMAPNRSKLYIGLAAMALITVAGGFYFYRGKVQDDRRLALVAEAVDGAKSLSPGWPAAIGAAAGEFYLREEKPDLKAGVRQMQDARADIRQTEAAIDKAGLLVALVAVQAQLGGDEARVNAKQAIDWDSAKRELRQTLQLSKALQREDGWLVLEELTRALRAIGPKQPLILSLAPEAMPSEADRSDALATVALTLASIKDPAADKLIEDLIQTANADAAASPSPRLVALLVANNQVAKARQIMPEPAGDDPPLPARLAYAEGFARAGELDKARKIANLPGSVEHRAAAWTMLADGALAAGNADELPKAVAFVAEQGKTFTLPAWAVMRLGRVCARAGRADLAGQLAESVKLPAVTPWLELSRLQAELQSTTSSLDPANVKSADKSAAQALAWIALARHNARVTRSDPRNMLNSWPGNAAKTAGAAGAALGIQDRN